MKIFSTLFFLTLITLSQGIAKVDCIEIIKHKREMNLIKDDKIYKSYKISLGKGKTGNISALGNYFIKRKITDSNYHHSLVISYPNPLDKQQAEKQGYKIAESLSIHGLASYFKYVPDFIQKAHRWLDWTMGSIAVTDNEIEEIFAEVDVGTPVIIFA